MREEVKLWWEQTQRDAKAAKNLFKPDMYEYSSFMAQQAAEKALKT